MAFILITGSASGIGAATLKLLQSQGHDVLGADIHNAEICADLSTPGGRESLLSQVRQRCHGRLDGAVLCAGLGPHHPAPGMIVAVNYFATVALLDALLPLLREGQHPAAVVISSIASVQLPWDRNPLASALEAGNNPEAERLLALKGDKASLLAYSGSKNALTVAIRKRAPAWGKEGVRLNTLAPGSVVTPMQQATWQDPLLVQTLQRSQTPLDRSAAPQEVAQVAAFLLSKGASFVHGAQWILDGGKDALRRPTEF